MERVISQADAQLLLEALRGMVTAHDGYRHGLGPCICAAHEAAREAISKAEKVRALAAVPVEEPYEGVIDDALRLVRQANEIPAAGAEAHLREGLQAIIEACVKKEVERAVSDRGMVEYP